jgi:thioredoxin-like negative regulator of GroEL
MHRSVSATKKLFFRALELAQNDRYEDAIRAFKASLQADPDDTEARYSLGLMYLLVGNKDADMEEYQALKLLDDGLARKLLDFISPSGQFSLKV